VCVCEDRLTTVWKRLSKNWERVRLAQLTELQQKSAHRITVCRITQPVSQPPNKTESRQKVAKMISTKCKKQTYNTKQHTDSGLCWTMGLVTCRQQSPRPTALTMFIWILNALSISDKHPWTPAVNSHNHCHTKHATYITYNSIINPYIIVSLGTDYFLIKKLCWR